MSAEKQDYNLVDLGFLDSILLPDKEPEEVDPNEAKYIINSRVVDKHTVKRTRVKLTPAVCDLCGFDLLAKAFEQNKVEQNNFELLSREVQIAFEGALKKHKQVAHSMADNLIITESQLAKTKRYLSGRSMQ